MLLDDVEELLQHMSTIVAVGCSSSAASMMDNLVMYYKRRLEDHQLGKNVVRRRQAELKNQELLDALLIDSYLRDKSVCVLKNELFHMWEVNDDGRVMVCCPMTEYCSCSKRHDECAHLQLIKRIELGDGRVYDQPATAEPLHGVDDCAGCFRWCIGPV